MLDESSLRRLAEIGIDVYVPRAARPVLAAVSTTTVQAAPAAHASPAVLLLADLSSSRAPQLLAAIARALAFAQVTSAQGANDEAQLASARALVAFGDAQARAAGALLPAQRQRDMAWVVTADLGALAGDARAKRALWSELKRIARLLRTNGA